METKNNQITFFETDLGMEAIEKEKKEIKVLRKHIEENPKTNNWQCYFELKNGIGQIKQVVVDCAGEDIKIIVPRLEMFQKYFDLEEFKKIVENTKKEWNKEQEPEEAPDWIKNLKPGIDETAPEANGIKYKTFNEDNLKIKNNIHDMEEHCMHCHKKHPRGDCVFDKDLEDN
jgi:hypothetical protein